MTTVEESRLIPDEMKLIRIVWRKPMGDEISREHQRKLNLILLLKGKFNKSRWV